MKKTGLYLTVLIILGIGVYFFIFRESDQFFDSSEAGFNVKDTARIGKIFMVRNTGENILLTRTDSGWVVNDGRYKTRKSTLDNLLRTLAMQRAQFPVSRNMHNSVVKNMSATNTKVELFDRKGKKFRTFFVGNAAYDYEGTFMLMKGAERPYVVKIPGFVGFLGPSFSTDFDDWRDRSVVLLGADEIKSLSVSYVHDPMANFTIYRRGDSLLFSAAPEVSVHRPANLERVKTYLGFFEEIYCEGYLNGIDGMDSTLASVPKYCILDVTAKNGWRQHIEIYKMPLTKRSKNLSSELGGNFDIDRMYAVINNFEDTILIQRYTFNKLFQHAAIFYEKDDPKEIMGVHYHPE